jgi:hypothetical protein
LRSWFSSWTVRRTPGDPFLAAPVEDLGALRSARVIESMRAVTPAGPSRPRPRS